MRTLRQDLTIFLASNGTHWCSFQQPQADRNGV